MKIFTVKNIVFLLFILTTVHCGAGSSSLTTGGTETGNTDKLAAAVTSLFGGSHENAQLKKHLFPAKLLALLLSEAQAQVGPPTSACNDTHGNAGNITMSTTITAGTYGLSSNSVTVTASDGCAEGGTFIGFTVVSHDMSCTDAGGTATTITMDQSTGVWRINATTHNTEIFGTFNMTSGGSTVSGVRCSFTIDNSQGPNGTFSGDCEDSSGASLSQATDESCTDA